MSSVSTTQVTAFSVLSEQGLRIRNAPSLEAEATGILPPGIVVVALERRHEWIRHALGWSKLRSEIKRFLKECPLYWQVLSLGGLRIRTAPDGDVIGILPSGTIVKAVEVKDVPPDSRTGKPTTWIRHLAGWSPVTQGGKVLLSSHIIAPHREPPVLRVCTSDPVKVWSGASLSSTHIGWMKPGASVNAYERRGEWFRHDRGWSMLRTPVKQFFELVETEPLSPHAEAYWSVVSPDAAKARAEQKAAELDLSGEASAAPSAVNEADLDKPYTQTDVLTITIMPEPKTEERPA